MAKEIGPRYSRRPTERQGATPPLRRAARRRARPRAGAAAGARPREDHSGRPTPPPGGWPPRRALASDPVRCGYGRSPRCRAAGRPATETDGRSALPGCRGRDGSRSSGGTRPESPHNWPRPQQRAPTAPRPTCRRAGRAEKAAAKPRARRRPRRRRPRSP